MAKPIITVKGVSKEFKLPHERTSSLKQALIHFKKQRFETYKVLQDVSFEVHEGEFFGILGRNGSGKSTLLKLLAGIYAPTHGSVHIDGTLTPFIEVGVGFNDELTGRENVFLNGSILGLTTKEIEQKYDEIVAFAELERFMDQKLKNYSSGMRVRLAFSVAIQAHNKILLIDEVLAVGDERFQDKCLKIFAKIKKDPTITVVFVSHDMGAVQRFCDRAMVVHDGKMTFIGDAAEAALEYRKLNFPDAVLDETPESDMPVHVKITDRRGKPKSNFNYGETAVVKVSWEPDERIKNVGVALFKDDDYYIFGTNTMLDKVKITENSVDYEVELTIGEGSYYTNIGFFGETAADKVYFINNGPLLTVNAPATWQGVTLLPHKWH